MRSWRYTLLPILALLLLSCQEGRAATASYIPHPDDPEEVVEYYLDRPAGEGPWPTVVLLHGHQAWLKPGGKDFVDWGALRTLAARGYLAVAISQPGYGGSTGPADYAGPRTVHAVEAVITRLRGDGLVSPKRLVLEGVSRGALTAGLVAAEDPEVSGVVLISGVYDLSAFVAEEGGGLVRSSIVSTLRAESGGSAEALKERSVLRSASRIKAALLILSGAEDDRADPDQARALAAAVQAAGGRAKVVVYPGVGHKIPVELRRADVDPFIDELLRGDGRGVGEGR